MKEWIRWWGLGVFAVVAALWILCIDWVIESSIEFAGTQAVGAKVELDSAELSLSDGTLTLNRLQVTNPDKPMQNLFEAERIHSQVDLLMLLRRQFISDEATIDGLNLYTERDSSGAIDGRLFSFSKKEGEEGADLDLTSKLNLPDVDQMVAEEKSRLQAEVDAMKAEVDDIQRGWEQRIAQLPSQEKLAEYRRRWEELEDQNALVRIKGTKELRDEIDDDLDALRELDEQIKTDRERIAALTERAKTLPKREADRLLASVGLDQGFEGMIRHIVGDEAYQMVQQGLSLYQTAASQLSENDPLQSEEEAKRQRGTGEYIRFAEDQPLPDFLIKRASINGSVPVAGDTIRFDGVLSDISNAQKIWGKPLALKASGGSDKGASLNLNGLFDHRGADPLDSLDFDLRKLDLQALQLSDNSKLPISLQQGVADISTRFALGKNGLDATVDSLVKQAEFLVAETAESSSAELLRKALTAAKQFDLKMAISGNPEDPSLKLKSSLDKLIGDVLGAELKAKVAEHKAELQSKLSESLSGSTAKLEGKGGFLDDYKGQLEEKRNALKALLKDLR
ncbi:uncharacterized protein (TIGR03545 family) [Litorivivens lipolytica]|uniref:Uncharacterized protein (TIGR03545 family) n=1 Tax=Litorivivens lipolytica TaxID=1524264 RepID=A0A7W4W784_9GAMM|nr:TIGR03545 family protein [Litorivivens lipolytica]MBB3048773.1 uncharacterized protein (TIGR03545 family) [Litorivivens lipolytica]